MSDPVGSSPAPYTLLYDGRCSLCTASSRRLVRLARPGAVEALDLHAPGVLDRFPQVSYDQAMRAIRLIGPGGRVSGGLAAVADTIATRAGPARLVLVYYLPLLRQVCDGLYWLIARNRYRLNPGGASACRDGTCRGGPAHTLD